VGKPLSKQVWIDDLLGVEIENFSGKSALSVKQDFYAKIIASNLTSLMALAAQKEVDKKTQKLQDQI
jgi:hypothetical protein